MLRGDLAISFSIKGENGEVLIVIVLLFYPVRSAMEVLAWVSFLLVGNNMFAGVLLCAVFAAVCSVTPHRVD